MAGFRKAKAEQAALKMGFYGAAGRGKTLTSLLLAEGLAATSGKRIAFVDTEHGTDFYTKAVPQREVHPEAFDFDALYGKSLTDVLSAVKAIKPEEYAVVVVDSITHLWEAARAAYSGPTYGKNDGIPIAAWGKIKKPYKELMTLLMNSPMHVIFCGREGKEIETDENDQMKIVGTKMKAEGETPYEPHILIHLFTERDKEGNTTIIAHAEKDRSGLLANRYIQLWPSKHSTFDLLAAPILPLLGHTQAQMPSEEDTAGRDAEALAVQDQQRIRESEALLTEWRSRVNLAGSAEELKAVGKLITTEIKNRMTPSDLASLRDEYGNRESSVTGGRRVEPVEAA